MRLFPEVKCTLSLAAFSFMLFMSVSSLEISDWRRSFLRTMSSIFVSKLEKISFFVILLGMSWWYFDAKTLKLLLEI